MTEEKILDVYLQYAEFGEEYSENNTIFGRVLVGKDDYFEGIIGDYNQKHLSLLFGRFNENEVEMTTCTEKDTEVPYTFRAFAAGKSYKGDFNAQNLYEEIRLGESRIVIMPADKTREEYEEEKNGIRLLTTHLRHHLGEIGTELHEDFEVQRIRNRNKVSQVQKVYY